MAIDSQLPHEDGPSELPTDVYVARWQAGNEGAFEVLFHRFGPLLAMRVRRHRVWPALSGQMQVDDAVQAIWGRVIPHARATFEPTGPGSFMGMLGDLVDKSLIDLLRLQTAAKRGYGEKTEPLANCPQGQVKKPNGSGDATPTSQARASEIRSAAEELLGERELTAWDLVEIQGFTSEEAGFALGCTAAAVRGLLLRSRTRLAEHFGEEEIPE